MASRMSRSWASETRPSRSTTNQLDPVIRALSMPGRRVLPLKKH